MSLILDALKKLEQEKAARRTRQMDLRPAVTGRRPPPAASPWRLPLLIAGAVAVTVAATVAVMGLFSPATPPAAPSPAEVQGETHRTPEPPSSPPAPAPDTPAVPPSSHAIPPAPAQTAPQAALPRPALPRPKSAPPEPAGPAPADIRVTGIAWQDERATRRAVVNGALLGEGALVSGAKIVEIRQDQVRFSRDGQTFAVTITSANR